jgi:hypothetical protein
MISEVNFDRMVMDANAQARIRIPDQLINQAVAAALAPGGTVRSLTVHALGGNRLDVHATTNKVFVPTINAQLAIERQPTLPGDPVLALRITGGAGTLLKFAGPFLAASLPPFVRLEHDLLLVDLRALATHYGQAASLAYVRDLRVSTEENAVLVDAAAGLP